MKFVLLCELRKINNTVVAVCHPCGLDLYNVLLVNDNIELYRECEHTFKLVVNKKGSLTLLCIK